MGDSAEQLSQSAVHSVNAMTQHLVPFTGNWVAYVTPVLDFLSSKNFLQMISFIYVVLKWSLLCASFNVFYEKCTCHGEKSACFPKLFCFVF